MAGWEVKTFDGQRLIGVASVDDEETARKMARGHRELGFTTRVRPAEATPVRESTHVAEIKPDGDGFLVECPHGCGLGTSASQPTRKDAERRVELHKISTTPLVPWPSFSNQAPGEQ